MKRLQTSTLVAIAVLFALTAYLFAFNRARRRAHVPAITIKLPPFLHTGKTRMGGVQALSFAPLGQRLVVADDVGHWFMADLQGGVPRSQGRHGYPEPGSIVWSRDALRVYGTQDGVLYWRGLRDAKWQSFVAVREDDPPARPTIKLSPDARFMLVSTYHEREGPWKPGALWLCDVPRGRRLWEEDLKADARGYLPFVCGSAISPDGQTVAVATMYFGSENTAKTAAHDAMGLWQKRLDIVLRRVRDGAVLRTIEFETAQVEITINGDGATKGIALAFSPDGRVLAAADNSKVCLFSSTGGSLLSTLPVAENNRGRMGQKPLVFSPDGRLLAVGFSKAIEVWDVQKKQRGQLFFGWSQNLSFSADSQWLASDNPTGEFDAVSIWEVGSLK